MRIVLFLVFTICILSGSATGQPTFNRQMPSAGFISSNLFYPFSTVQPGSAGPNQTWSFSFPSTGSVPRVFEFVLPSNTMFPDSFPASTIASKSSLIQGASQYQFFDYYKMTNNLAELIGSIITGTEEVFINRYSNPMSFS